MDDDKIWRSARVCWGYEGGEEGLLISLFIISLVPI